MAEVIIQEDNSWQLKGEDSRLKHSRDDHEVAGKHGMFMDPVFCFSCGKSGGLAFRSTVFVLYQCQDCADKYGAPPLPKMPVEDEIKWRNGRKD